MRHFLLSVCGEEQSLYEPLDSPSYISTLLLPTSKEGFAFYNIAKKKSYLLLNLGKQA